jgi:hypothetical protein
MDRLNNAWTNLRLATRSQQKCNQKVRGDSLLGVKGVVAYRTGKDVTRYAWRRVLNGVRVRRGGFATVEEAKAAGDAAAKEIHGGFFRA